MRRAAPRLILFDQALNVVFAEQSALECLEGEPLAQPLPEAVRAALGRPADAESSDRIVSLAPNLLARICPLSGNGSSFIAVLLESECRRSDLRFVAERFSLTRRETEVLRLMLEGLNAGDIARRLSIAENTVADYFKQLLRKTNARNRAEMVAQIMDVDGIARH